MDISSGSRVSLLNQRKGGKSITIQDRLLLCFYSMPGSTAKEAAFDLVRRIIDSGCDDHSLVRAMELFGNSPKRARDLCGKNLQYIELIGNRECKRTGADAHIFRITQRGIDHLSKVGLMPSEQTSVNVPMPMPGRTDKQTGPSALKELLT